MEHFKNFIISLCGAGIITSIFKILINNSKVKKSVNIFLSMFVFLYMIMPIEEMYSNINLKINNEAETSSYTDIYKTGYENIIIESIENVCAQYDAKIVYINIESNIDNEGYLIINKIELQLDDINKNEKIKNELKEKFKYEVIFI